MQQPIDNSGYRSMRFVFDRFSSNIRSCNMIEVIQCSITIFHGHWNENIFPLKTPTPAPSRLSLGCCVHTHAPSFSRLSIGCCLKPHAPSLSRLSIGSCLWAHDTSSNNFKSYAAIGIHKFPSFIESSIIPLFDNKVYAFYVSSLYLQHLYLIKFYFFCKLLQP